MSSLTIREVETPKDLKTFIRQPDAIYRDDPNWVRPLMFERMSLLDARRNPYFHHAEARYFLAERNGRAVGRISAQIDRILAERMGETIGHFGLFEAEDDPEIARALFASAESWLKARGAVRAEGPFNLSTNGECGLLIEGFDTPPAVMMGHARPGYASMIEAQGYRKIRDLYAYEIDLLRDLPERVSRIITRFEQRDDFRLRQIDMKRYDEELAVIVDIFNDAWSENWGFVPLDEAESRHLAKELRPLIAAHRVAICEHHGKPVGMMIVIPDLNSIVARTGGELFPFGWAHLLYGLLGPYPKRLRTPLMGVRKDYQRSLWGGAIALSMIERLRRESVRRGSVWAELSWILENNTSMRRMLEDINCWIYKTYRIYTKDL